MKNLLSIAFSIVLSSIFLVACTKYSDPDPIDDPNLDARKYCNDIEAVNFNWGFPGTPDNSICIYPADNLAGIYTVYDSTFDASDSLWATAIFSNVEISRLENQKILVKNICSQDQILLCDRHLNILIDTLGQQTFTLCGTDSVSFSGIKYGLDTMTFQLKKENVNKNILHHEMTFQKN